MNPRIVEAEEAAKAEALMKPFVDKALEELLDKMEAQYNNPEATMDQFYGYVGELVALRSLKKTFNAKRRNGLAALKQETQHAEG